MTDPFCVGVDINRNVPIGWDHVRFYKPATADFVNVALDLPVDLPRGKVDADELRRSPEYAELRTEVGRAVKAGAA